MPLNMMVLGLLDLLYLSGAVRGSGLIRFCHEVNLPTCRPLIIAHRDASGILPEHTRKIYFVYLFDFICLFNFYFLFV